MKKRILSILLATALFSALLIPSFSSLETKAEPVAEAPLKLTMPETDGKTEGKNYVLGAGCDDEFTVSATKFIPTSMSQRPGSVQTQYYLVIHNTGNYGVMGKPTEGNATAHFQYLTTSSGTGQSYHYVVGSDAVYQLLPENERAMHAGTNTSGNGVMNSNSIGMEICVNEFSSLTRYEGEQWNSEAMYDWYVNCFKERTGRAALLAASICVRNGFNPYTQVVTHNSVYGKNCPMQMRYLFGSASGPVGDVVGNCLNGTYWLIFWDKMIEYYEALGGTYKSTDTAVVGSDGTKLTQTGTSVYYPGKYKVTATDTLNIRNAATSSGTEIIGELASGTEVTVTEIVSTNWGKISYNGTDGYIHLGYTQLIEVQAGIEVPGDNPISSVTPATEYINAIESPTLVSSKTNGAWTATKNLTVTNSNKYNYFVLQGYLLHPSVAASYEYQVNGGEWLPLESIRRFDLEQSKKGYSNYVTCGYLQEIDIKDFGTSNTIKVRATLGANETLDVGTLSVNVTFPSTNTTAPTTPTTSTTVNTKLKKLETKAGSTLYIYGNENDEFELQGATENTPVSQIIAQFTSSVTVVDAQGNNVDGTKLLGTSMIIKSTDKSVEATSVTVILKGDTNGDGIVNATDYLQIKRSFLKTFTLTGVFAQAGDVDSSDNIDATDYLQIKRHFLKTYNLFSK